MIEWLEPLTHTSPFEWRKALVSILLAFGLTQAIAGTYMLTFRGLSYSRTVVQGMATASIITCTLMLAVGNSVAAGIGIAGGLSAVRFRTTLRDPRDIVFVFVGAGAGAGDGAREPLTPGPGFGVGLGAAVAAFPPLHVAAESATQVPEPAHELGVVSS